MRGILYEYENKDKLKSIHEILLHLEGRCLIHGIVVTVVAWEHTTPTVQPLFIIYYAQLLLIG